jgi:hypothetical protein
VEVTLYRRVEEIRRGGERRAGGPRNATAKMGQGSPRYARRVEFSIGPILFSRIGPVIIFLVFSQSIKILPETNCCSFASVMQVSSNPPTCQATRTANRDARAFRSPATSGVVRSMNGFMAVRDLLQPLRNYCEGDWIPFSPSQAKSC